MNKLSKILAVLLIITFSFIVIISNFRFLVFSEAYYDFELKKLNIYDELPEAKFVTKNLIDFFQGKQALAEVFNEKETEHLIDVKNLINTVLLFYYSVALISIMLLLSLFLLNKKQFFNKLISIFIYSSLLILIVSVVLFVFSLKFDFLFTAFHSMFFQEGTWLFPADSVLIQIFPDKFFYDFFYKIILYSTIEAVLIIFVCFLIRKNKEIRLT